MANLATYTEIGDETDNTDNTDIWLSVERGAARGAGNPRGSSSTPQSPERRAEAPSGLSVAL